MAQIHKQFRFEAAHQLPAHFGKCAHLHGHSYTVTVTLEGPIRGVRSAQGDLLSDGGMVEDFDLVSRVVKPLIEEKCDHRFLNDTLPIERTTAELIACWFFGEIARELDARGVTEGRLHSIQVQETATSGATAFRDDWIAVGCPGWPEASRERPRVI